MSLADPTLAKRSKTHRARQKAKLSAMREALERIERWEMPQTGKAWDDGSPMSYASCYGSNGERDYIRMIARKALGDVK